MGVFMYKCQSTNCTGVGSLIDYCFNQKIFVCGKCYMKKHFPELYREKYECRLKDKLKKGLSSQSFQKRKTFKGFPLNVIPLKK